MKRKATSRRSKVDHEISKLEVSRYNEKNENESLKIRIKLLEQKLIDVLRFK